MRYEAARLGPGAVARWLPRLAPHLPVATPAPVLVGEPGEGFGWRWSVVPWLPGAPPAACDQRPTYHAADLAAYVGALHAIDATGAPVVEPGDRGDALVHWDQAVRDGVAAARPLAPEVDWAAVLAAWDDAVAAPAWAGRCGCPAT